MFTKRKINKIIYSDYFTYNNFKTIVKSNLEKDNVVWVDNSPYKIEELKLLRNETIQFNMNFDPYNTMFLNTYGNISKAIFFRNVCICIQKNNFLKIYIKNHSDNWVIDYDTGLKNKVRKIYVSDWTDDIEIEYISGKYDDDVLCLLKLIEFLYEKYEEEK